MFLLSTLAIPVLLGASASAGGLIACGLDDSLYPDAYGQSISNCPSVHGGRGGPDHQGVSKCHVQTAGTATIPTFQISFNMWSKTTGMASLNVTMGLRVLVTGIVLRIRMDCCDWKCFGGNERIELLHLESSVKRCRQHICCLVACYPMKRQSGSRTPSLLLTNTVKAKP
ncbi:hypothetical protein CERZMDRAFT_83426 [Cercospora zeae-maydis SCOH1-5]|uniref:Uncharacterized protein n=1 Tax=Cercospora zeae-maydis SCOH1-5 TaxID=717836 RepID=A0A6A6FL56_9PEZI|nr:hypothetical protein CERZMDRAFT_83426 [Cercospora zeae-maydis SCOH1-5]